MKRPLVGESMSKVTNVDTVVEGIGDFYESQQALLVGKPLDIGRLAYILLHRACKEYPDITDYDVNWNHLNGMLTFMIETVDKSEQMREHPSVLFQVQRLSERAAVARQQRLAVINDTINRMLIELGLM